MNTVIDWIFNLVNWTNKSKEDELFIFLLDMLYKNSTCYNFNHHSSLNQFILLLNQPICKQ